MCANTFRLPSTASHAPTLPLNSRLDSATPGLFHITSTGSGTAPNRMTIFSLSSLGSSAFGTRTAMVSSIICMCLYRHEDTARSAPVTAHQLAVEGVEDPVQQRRAYEVQ